MTTTRKTLSLRLKPAEPDDIEVDAPTLLRQAVDHLLCVRWTYNRSPMQGAPQILYIKNDSLHCDAVVLERDGSTVPEPKLATFKVAGMSNVALTSDPFAPSSPIDPSDPRYAGGIVSRAQD